ncbi:MAG: glycosyltransferase family 2 protein [Firmicutes bacterium]|nr:glycosyltransferase family 2 protein [Bacillota bacterium]
MTVGDGPDSSVCAVIPVRNEEDSIVAAVSNAKAAGAGGVHVVVNGSSDRTAGVALGIWPPVSVHVFAEPLGVDVPRAIGAALCLAGGRFSAVLFLDGDMAGPVGRLMRGLVEPVARGELDLALTDCTGGVVTTAARGWRGLFAEVTEARLELNRRLGLVSLIGAASPSHGPFACSPELLRRAGPILFAVPPCLLAVAALNGLQVGVGMRVRHDALGSPDRGPEHARMIADTIIGDCAEALAYFEGLPRTRAYEGRARDGLNPSRRADILERAVQSILAS